MKKIRDTQPLLTKGGTWVVIYFISVIAPGIFMIAIDPTPSINNLFLMMLFWPVTLFFWLNEGAMIAMPFSLLYPVLYFAVFQPFIKEQTVKKQILAACIALALPLMYTVVSLQLLS